MKTLRLLNYLLVAVLTVTWLLACGDKEENVTDNNKADSLINVAHKNHEYERLLNWPTSCRLQVIFPISRQTTGEAMPIRAKR